MNTKTNTVNGLTQDSLFVFIRDINQAENELATTRLALFQKQAEVTDMASFKTAATDCAATHAKDKDAQVIKSRISESRQLYGAIRFAGLNVAGLGYHTAVKAARDGLAAKAIKYDGSKILVLTDEAKQAKQVALRRAEATVAAKVGFDWNQEKPLEALAEKTNDIMVKLEKAEIADKTAKAMEKIATAGDKIIKDYGLEYAASLCAYLGKKVAEAKQTETKQLKVA